MVTRPDKLASCAPLDYTSSQIRGDKAANRVQKGSFSKMIKRTRSFTVPRATAKRVKWADSQAPALPFVAAIKVCLDCTFPIADPCAYLYSTPLHSPHKNVSRRLPLPASTAPRTGSTSCRRRLDLDSGPFLSRGAVGATTKSAASAVPRPSSGRLTTSRKRPGAPV